MTDHSPAAPPAVSGTRAAAVAECTPRAAGAVHRAGVYGLLAALLREPAAAELLEYAAGLGDGDGRDDLTVALSMLALAATHCSPQDLEDEFHQLFIGLGRGELVPYGSWYQTGYLMERPLAVLRDDLVGLGFEREADNPEPEDHVAALCEVMAMLVEDAAPEELQAHFFTSHLESWIERFFGDLAAAQGAVFYRSVGRLGLAFMAAERRRLAGRG